MDLLRKTGRYNRITGYLWYLTLGEVTEVR